MARRRAGGTLPAPQTQPTQAFRGGTADVAGQTGLSGVPRLSIRRFEYDPMRVVELAFGRKPEVDEHTGAWSAGGRGGR